MDRVEKRLFLFCRSDTLLIPTRALQGSPKVRTTTPVLVTSPGSNDECIRDEAGHLSDIGHDGGETILSY
jgi:hypothetical protein